MTYEEYFQYRQEMNKMSGHEATEQEIDEEIALVSELPYTGGGVPEPLFGGQQECVQLDLRALDRGERFPGLPCPHCTRLAVYKWIKSMHEAKRNGTHCRPSTKQKRANICGPGGAMSAIARTPGPDPRETVKEGEDVLVLGKIVRIEGDTLTVEISGMQLKVDRYHIVPMVNQ